VARKGRGVPLPAQFELLSRNNMEPRIAHRAMIRVQPERQEKYGGDETAGTRVFGRTVQDNGTGFAAKPDSGYGVCQTCWLALASGPENPFAACATVGNISISMSTFVNFRL